MDGSMDSAQVGRYEKKGICLRSGLSIFAVTISRSNTSVYSTFGWRSENERLVVTVDWTQSAVLAPLSMLVLLSVPAR
ncbi:hypothetical protein EGR_11021 [Echinococcus granulosus]|uniref:Uncharacterized protein n=1 Tax=Echinococcus granulosus TaxID=6210 RepID=W6U0Y5_ECHGR|nr:hypothetical protein EGR_11021 [Echinococcus granulosus]EUB54121.1 hypothetical protein EGR_11021 [Echinococcus granulosus]